MVSVRRIYRYLSAPRRRLPDYIVVGAQKAGTTSLWAYLREHPNVEPPITKEVGFFDVNFHRGTDWYRMHFPLAGSASSSGSAGQATLTGEATPYYLFHPLAPERVARTIPDMKIIAVLRNPVDRAFSHYQLKLRRLQENLSFEEAIDAEAERLAGEHERIMRDPAYYSQAHDRYSYLVRGQYLEQIRRWQQYFSGRQMLIIESSELFQRTGEVFDRVLDFLELPRWRPARFGNRYPGEYDEKMSDKTRRRLVDYFAPHNERLYAHLGVRFDWDR